LETGQSLLFNSHTFSDKLYLNRATGWSPLRVSTLTHISSEIKGCHSINTVQYWFHWVFICSHPHTLFKPQHRTCFYHVWLTRIMVNERCHKMEPQIFQNFKLGSQNDIDLLHLLLFKSYFLLKYNSNLFTNILFISSYLFLFFKEWITWIIMHDSFNWSSSILV